LGAATVFLDLARDIPFTGLPGEPDPRLIGELIGVRVRLATGDLRGARAGLARLRGNPHTNPDTISMLAADIALRTGEPPRYGAPLGCGDSSLARGRLLLANGDVTDALTVAEPYLDMPADEATPRDRLAALLLAVLAQRRLGAADTATSLLEQALALAEPHQLYRPFLDGGTPVRYAVTALTRPESHVASFAGRVLQRFSYQEPGGHGRTAAAAALSSSELAVLRFLSSHLTNQEIADALCLSVNTVKTHLRTAYRKLGVTSRRQAIARSERLGLL
jgi:LuxR family transcriptional regulator, maltose regulon positive regulatory protein